jgi:hypothetical protein
MRVESSGVGVKQVYIRQTDMPAAPASPLNGLKWWVKTSKERTIHIYSGAGEYPLIVIDDITDGRLVASAEAYLQPGYYVPLFGDFEFEGRAVLLDAQFTGIIPDRLLHRRQRHRDGPFLGWKFDRRFGRKRDTSWSLIQSVLQWRAASP